MKKLSRETLRKFLAVAAANKKVLSARLLWLSMWSAIVVGVGTYGLFSVEGLLLGESSYLVWLAGAVCGVPMFLLTLMRDYWRRDSIIRRAWQTPIEQWDMSSRLDYDFGTMAFYRVSSDGYKAGLRWSWRWRAVFIGMLALSAVVFVALLLQFTMLNALDGMLSWIWRGPVVTVALMFIGLALFQAEPQTLDDKINKQRLFEVLETRYRYWVLAGRLFALSSVSSVMTASWYALADRLQDGDTLSLPLNYTPWMYGASIGAVLFVITLVRDKWFERNGWIWAIGVHWGYLSISAHDLGLMAFTYLSAGERRKGLRHGKWKRFAYRSWWSLCMVFIGTFVLTLSMDGDMAIVYFWISAVVSTAYFLAFMVLALMRFNPEFQNFSRWDGP